MKGLKLRKVIGLFLLVLCLAGVLVAHVWKQNTYVRLSIDAVKLSKENARLRNALALLELETGELKKMSRIESLARGRFGLELAKTTVPVYPEGVWAEEKGARMAGETKVEAGKVSWQTRGL